MFKHSSKRRWPCVGSIGVDGDCPVAFATLAGCVAILFWSTTVALARNLSESLGPITGAAAAYSVAGLASMVALLRNPRQRNHVRKLPARYLFVCGGLMIAYAVLIFVAVGGAASDQQVLELGLVNYLWPTLTLVLSLVLLGKRATWLMIPGTLLALAGIFLVVTQGGAVSWHSLTTNLAANPAAYALALAAAVCWALYSNLTRRWAGGEAEGAVSLFLPATAVVLLLIAMFVDEPRIWTVRGAAEILFLGLATYGSYTLWDLAMRRGNVVLVAATSYLTPLLSTLVTCAYLAVLPGMRLWVGCGVLVAGSVISWWAVHERDTPSPAPRQVDTTDPNR